VDRTYTVLHLFCGLGGAQLGFAAARPRYLDSGARFRCVAGVDNDPAACADFAELTGAPVLQGDIAALAESPDGPDRLRAVAGDEALGRARRGEPWDPDVLRLVAGERLDELAAAVGLRREHAGSCMGRETDADLSARARKALA
jgi:hypothetical protein